MTKVAADQFLKEAAGMSVCVRYEFNREGQVVFGRPAPDRVQRQIHGARKMLAAAALVMIPLLSACSSEPEDCGSTTPESTLIQGGQAILEKLASIGFEVEAILDYINPFDPYETMVMGAIAVVDPIEEPGSALLEVLPDEEILMPTMGQMMIEPPNPEPETYQELGEIEPEPEIYEEMMGDLVVEEPVKVEPVIVEERNIRMGKIKMPERHDRAHDIERL